jgi:hypothetical protein
MLRTLNCSPSPLKSMSGEQLLANGRSEITVGLTKSNNCQSADCATGRVVETHREISPPTKPARIVGCSDACRDERESS